MELGRVLLVRGIEFVARAAAEAVPPVISGWTPAANAAIDRADSVGVTVTDDVSLSTATISARYDALGIEEMIYDGEAFAAAYSGSSVVVTSSTQVFAIIRDAGWLDAFMLRVTAVDGDGNRALDAAGYEVRGALGVAVPAMVPAGWSRPTLQDLIDSTRADFRALDGGEAPLFRRSVESVLAKVMPALAH